MESLDQFNGYLMSKDRELAVIEQGQVAQILDAARLPFHFTRAADSSLKSWMAQRAMDVSRTNSRFLLNRINYAKDDIDQLVLSVNAATITDTYWLKEKGSGLTFEETRFQHNDLARVALLGSSAGNPGTESRRSPEFTNTGSFEKCWRIEDGKWWLYKSGNLENTFSELACYKIGRYLGLEMAYYENVTRQEINRIFNSRVPLSFSAVRSLDYTNGAFCNFEPASDLGCERQDAPGNYKLLSALSPTAAEQYRGMVLLDALIYNGDRHLLNFGVLRDVDTGVVLKLAPIYDQNVALWMALMDYNIIMAGERDNLYSDWARMVDSIGEPVHIPSLGRKAMEDLINGVELPGFPDEQREEIIQILTQRGGWIEDRVKQINKIYPL